MPAPKGSASPAALAASPVQVTAIVCEPRPTDGALTLRDVTLSSSAPDDPGTRATGLEGGRTTMSHTPIGVTSGEVQPPYRSGPAPGGQSRPKRTRIHHLRELKERGER